MALLNPNHINDLFQSILDVACNCLEDTPLGAPADCYISHNQPADDCCFAAETRIVTSGGVTPIGDLVGQEVELMTTDGEWVKAPIGSFGTQALRRITLTRYREQKVLYATGNHRWLLDGRSHMGLSRNIVEKNTDQLSAGDTLALETGAAPTVEMDPEGIRAGIIYGDGTSTPWGSRITLYGPKAALASWFAEEREGAPDARFPESRSFSGMPTSWKSLPEVSEDLGFLLGWLAGYVATDGSVNGTSVGRTSVRLASSKRHDLEVVRDICYRLGIATSKINVQMRKGFNAHETPLFSVSLSPSTLPEGFLIRGDQAEKMGPSSRGVARWKVVSVEETDRVEEVFCATVEGTRAFVLEDNILTGNCDFLAIWLDRIRPRVGFENAQYITGEKVWAKCGDVGAVADFSLRLMRPCYPTLVDNPTNPFPPAVDIQAAAENLLIDIQVLRCCISAAYCQGLLLPDTADADCLELAIGDIVPAGPRGGCAGWTLLFAVELDSCWYGDVSLSS